MTIVLLVFDRCKRKAVVCVCLLCLCACVEICVYVSVCCVAYMAGW
jgi:hypothetical protein